MVRGYRCLHDNPITLDGASYTVDNAGNRTAKTDQYASVTSNYSYDAIYELTQVTQSSTTTKSYSFDPVGNRLSSLGVSSYTNNSSNELTSTSNATYTYDNSGNTLTKVVGSNTTQYFWDYENRMSSVTLPGSGGTVSFKYDPFGRRIYKSSSSGTSVFAYDGDNLIEETNASGTAVARYSQGLNIDEPLAMLRSSTTSYYQADGLGSVTSLSNTSGSNSATYTYDSFGNLTASTGSLTNPFQYTARESDPETGLYYYRARYYDPKAGRFLNEDPIGFGGGVNFYAYVHNGATNSNDPRGLDNRCPSWWPDWLCSLVKGAPKAPPPPTSCLCTRTIVKPQPYPTATSKVYVCFYSCDCFPNKKFLALWNRLVEQKGCKNIKDCPYQFVANIDPSSGSSPLIPDPNFPITKDPPPKE